MRGVATVLALLCCVTWAYAADPAPQAGDAITPTEVTPLFNGKDLTGWHKHLGEPSVDPNTVWTVKDGVIHCTGNPPGYIRTEKDYKDYVFEVEYRWPGKGGNSGALVHMSGEDIVWPKSIECQLMSNNAGDFFVIGGTEFAEHKANPPDDRRVPNKVDGAEKPLGEWNTMRVVCKDNTITVFVNGKEVNKATETNVDSGKICLQSEGTPIEFRRIELQPLPKE